MERILQITAKFYVVTKINVMKLHGIHLMYLSTLEQLFRFESITKKIKTVDRFPGVALFACLKIYGFKNKIKNRDFIKIPFFAVQMLRFYITLI